MINIRDHLGGSGLSEDQTVASARDFLREAYLRVRLLGPLRGSTTKMGNRILVLGGSEVGLSCAHILDLQGFKVRLVHRCRLKGGSDLLEGIAMRPVTDTIGKDIAHVPEAVIESIKGHLGDFHATVSENGKRRQWKADIVCLTDLNLLPLAIPVDMFGLKKFYRFNFAFFNTPQIGVFRVMPRTLGRVSAFQAGAALAAHVATAARVAGDKMDEAIVEYIKKKYRLLIGSSSAEIIKMPIGSAFPGNTLETLEVKGRDLTTRTPKVLRINSDEVREAISDQVNAIVGAVRTALEQMPPELAADLIDCAIMLAGGGALLKNLDLMLRAETKLPTKIAADPLSAVALGAGEALSNLAILKNLGK